jgi:opacity protein-like surface antigen
MRLVTFVTGLILAGGVVASAQERPATPAAEVGFNYSYARINPSGTAPSYNQNGGSGYVEYNINRVVGVVADLGAYHNSSVVRSSPADTTFSYLFGPRFNWRMSRVTPYLQILVGGARLTSSFDPGSATAALLKDRNVFATAIGGGVDVRLTNHIAVKPVQVEYFMTQLPSVATNLNYAQNNLRYSAGVVWQWGAK